MRTGPKMIRQAMVCTAAIACCMGPASAQDTQDNPELDPDFPMKRVETPHSRSTERSSDPASEAQTNRSAPGDEASNTGAPSILAILAHPDDELTIAPVLARTARSGGDVALIFATSGDAGPGVSEMEPGEELASLREGEARCAAFALGLDEPQFWQFGDGTLGTMAREPRSTARALKARVMRAIINHEPDVVMTWGPDGGYGHADHRTISNIVTEVVQAMGRERPELLFPALPSEEGMPGQLAGWAKTHPSLVTDRLRYEEPDLEAMRIATDCYQSQFDEAARTALPELLHRSVWRGNVFFRLAFPTAE